tara:strand:+ start:439 stop:621 length:183 start_codon:yes stop_codon:yes gene_type:complete
MDYQNKGKFKKEQKRKKAKLRKVTLRRKGIREEAQVQRMIDKMNYESRQRFRPFRKPKEE